MMQEVVTAEISNLSVKTCAIRRRPEDAIGRKVPLVGTWDSTGSRGHGTTGDRRSPGVRGGPPGTKVYISRRIHLV